MRQQPREELDLARQWLGIALVPSLKGPVVDLKGVHPTEHRPEEEVCAV